MAAEEQYQLQKRVAEADVEGFNHGGGDVWVDCYWGESVDERDGDQPPRLKTFQECLEGKTQALRLFPDGIFRIIKIVPEIEQ